MNWIMSQLFWKKQRRRVLNLLRTPLVLSLNYKIHRYSRGSEGPFIIMTVSVINKLVKRTSPRIAFLSPLSDFMLYVYLEPFCIVTGLDTREISEAQCLYTEPLVPESHRHWGPRRGLPLAPWVLPGVWFTTWCGGPIAHTCVAGHFK